VRKAIARPAMCRTMWYGCGLPARLADKGVRPPL